MDVTLFANSHPGGRFLIERNAGKDISKFFHGGYNLEPQNGGWNHKHSNYARTIVSDLIVARLAAKREAAVMAITDKSTESTIATYEFKSVENNSEENPLLTKIKLFYDGTEMLGKHYLV